MFEWERVLKDELFVQINNMNLNRDIYDTWTWLGEVEGVFN